jgi:hypothetical protein
MIGCAPKVLKPGDMKVGIFLVVIYGKRSAVGIDGIVNTSQFFINCTKVIPCINIVFTDGIIWEK